MNGYGLCSLSWADFLSYLKDAEGRKCLIPMLEELRPFRWAEPADLSVLKTGIPPASPPGFLNLCRRYLLAQALLHPVQKPAQTLSGLRDWIDPATVLEGLAREPFPAGSWRAAPVLVVDEKGQVHRRYFIAGVCRCDPGPVLPSWSGSALDAEARSAVEDAARAVAGLGFVPADHRLFCFPLVHSDGRVRIRDRSLGLSLALAWMSAADGKPMPERIAATGAVSESGSVETVGFLEKKTSFLADETRRGGSVRAFLYPAENNEPMSGPLIPVPVSTLQQAWVFACLYAPGREIALLRFSEMLKDPAEWVRNVAGIPSEWLQWARQNGHLREVMSQVASNPSLFIAWVDAFGALVSRCELPIAREMAALIVPEELGKLMHSAPLAAFRWCSLNLALANHEGASDEADVWIDRGLELVPVARRADLAAVADFFNHHCVSLHNRYRFQPETPDYLRSIMKLLEEQYEVQKTVCPSFPVLGRLYGTLVQHLAFCGADHLDRVRSLSEKAQVALGRDSVPEYRPEWLRQYSYLAYACLDAGNLKEAEQALFRYLEVNDWDDARGKLPDMSQWEQALLARCLADFQDAGLCRAYQEQMDVVGKDGCGEYHPWQLWCWNRGRIALCMGDREGASAWFEKSVDLCFSGNVGDTVRVMALLPLAGLRHIRQLGDDALHEREGAIRTAARRLNPVHFRMVVESTRFAGILERVWACPGDLFPFSYR